MTFLIIIKGKYILLRAVRLATALAISSCCSAALQALSG
jgi:hypothetical protein